jgi:hypothetical protein
LCGYTLILIIDKVLFDTHVILGDDNHCDKEHTSKASMILRKSIAEVMRKSVAGEVSTISIENAIRKSLV